MAQAEDAMKWWVLRPDANTYDFRQGDELIRSGQAHTQGSLLCLPPILALLPFAPLGRFFCVHQPL